MPIVSLEGKKDFEAQDEEVIYHALERQGHELAHGCLSGSCGACKIEILSGSDSLLPAGAVESNTLDSLHNSLTKQNIEIDREKMRLSCRAKVKGNISIKPL